MPVRLTASRNESASCQWDDETGRPLALNISRHAPRPHLAVVHELGHLLDQQALGRGRELASESGRIPGVMDAIDGTAATRRLRDLRSRRQILLRIQPHRRERFSLDPRLIDYLLEPKEQFARAYAQYVATKSADAHLMAQLQSVRRDLFLGMVYHQQWDDDDFVPALTAIDQMLRRRRWIE
jgi:hypothetical protein